MTRSIHDNRLLGYSVDDRERTVRLRTVFQDRTPHEFTDVCLSGVEAYFFEHHSLSVGTILSGIEALEVQSFLKSTSKAFADGLKWGWPGAWAKSPDDAAAFIQEKGLMIYEISSSCGLSGWVLGTDYQLVPVR